MRNRTRGAGLEHSNASVIDVRVPGTPTSDRTAPRASVHLPCVIKAFMAERGERRCRG
jgi:hypothetical protein